MTTVLSRGARVRRRGHRPGWGLLTALLVLAIAASSGLVFTSRVELLKLAVILALWAAVMAAFVSVIYRRQSDTDQARARDLKLVYDLQLDREISARREYELTVESQLRRELASELRAQAADEVAALRAELTALRTNLEVLFDTDLARRPALETERTTVRAYSDWGSYDSDSAPGPRVSHVAAAARSNDTTIRTAENPIIDVPEVGVPAGGSPSAPPWQSWQPPAQPAAEAPRGYAEAHRGSHRRESDEAAFSPPGAAAFSPRERPSHAGEPYFAQHSRPQPGHPGPQHEPRPEPSSAHRPAVSAADWQPVGAEGRWLPPGAPGSNWTSDAEVNSHGTSIADESVDLSAVSNGPTPQHGRHSRPPEAAGPVAGSVTGSSAGTGETRRYDEGRRRANARHSAEAPSFRGETAPANPPRPVTPPPPPPRFAVPPDIPPPTASSEARHRGADPETGAGAARPQTGEQSVADLLARLQTGSTGGRRRRRRAE